MNTAEQLPPHGDEQYKLPIGERVLTEVNHLLEARLPGGGWTAESLDAVSQNLRTAVQEAAMPYAVSTARYEAVYSGEHAAPRTFQWLGKTAVQSAMSGYQFHYHDNALKRVDVEVDEARYAQEDHQPRTLKVFISPRMSRADASYEEAKREHLADDDAVRMSWLETNEDGIVTDQVIQSLLVRDIPLSAWVAMLRDPDNIFGKSIDIADETSALSVMKVHRELELPVGMISGPVDVLGAVVSYINDEVVRTRVQAQIERYYDDQEAMTKEAENQAAEWLAFEMQLAESLYQKEATYEIRRFIISMQHEWNEDELQVINRHATIGAGFAMSRELAVVVERLKQNTLWGSAAVAVGNEKVLAQLSPEAVQQIQDNQRLIEIARASGMEHQALMAQNARLIAHEEVEVGGGCVGGSSRKRSRPDGLEDPLAVLESSGDGPDDGSDRSNWKWKKGVCRIEACSTRPGETKVGPCSVCEKCQKEFDKGNDPTKARVAQAAGTLSLWFAALPEPTNKAEQKALVAASDKTPTIDRELQSMLEEAERSSQKQIIGV